MGREFPSDGFVPDLKPVDPRGGMQSSYPDAELFARINQSACLDLATGSLDYHLPHDGLPYGVPAADVIESA